MTNDETMAAAAAQMAEARAALEDARFDEARERYQAALLIRPDFADAAVELADLLMSDAQPLAAMQMLRAATDHCGDDARIWLRLAEAVSAVSGDARIGRRLFERAASLGRADASLVARAARGLAKLGLTQASEAMLTRASAEKTEPKPVRDLARLHDQQGDVDEALAAWLQLLGLVPNDLEALRRAAELYITREENAEAVALLERATKLAPNDLKIVVRLGYALYGDGQYARAVLAFERVLKAVPDLLAIHLQIGRCLVHTGEMQRAIPHLRRVLRAEPKNNDARVAYAAATAGTGRDADAEQMLRDVIRVDPDHALAQVHLATLLAKRGQIEDAEQRLVRAIEIEPRYASAYFQGAWSGAYADAERIERVLADTNIRRHDRMLMHFAAAKIHDKQGNAELAWRHSVDANALKQVRYDGAARERLVDALIEAFPGGADEPRGGCATEAPIFIVGMPRSGTSLVERILAAHPEVVALGERTAMLELARDMGGRIGSSATYPDCAPPPGDPNWRSMAEAFIEELPPEVGPGMRFTDKMPANAFHVGLIARLFPNARIIHTRRRLLDSCLSCWFTPFVRDHLAWSYDLDNLASYARSYQRVMEHWRATTTAELFEIDYEALVADPEQATRDLVEFVGLPWNDACLAPEQADASLDTASVYQARRPIYRTSVNKYDKYRPFAGPLLALDETTDATVAA